MLFNLCSTWPPRLPFIPTGDSICFNADSICFNADIICFNADLAVDGFGDTVDRILSSIDWIGDWIVDD